MKSTAGLSDGMASLAVRREFEALLNYFGLRFSFARDQRAGDDAYREYELRVLRGDLPKHVDRLITTSRTWDLQARVVDLQRLSSVDDARQTLERSWGPDITVVAYGKGKQLLHGVFVDQLSANAELCLLGRAGQTPQRPTSRVGVVISRALNARWEAAVDALPESERRPELTYIGDVRRPRGRSGVDTADDGSSPPAAGALRSLLGRLMDITGGARPPRG